MNYEIKYKPSYALLVVNLDQGETITAESGAMTYMTPNIESHTRKREKSLLGSLGLAIIGGQSFWVNDYTATNGQAQVAFAAAPVGDVETLEIKPNEGYIIQKSAYIASTQNVDLDVKWEGFTNTFIQAWMRKVPRIVYAQSHRKRHTFYQYLRRH